ncbi:hypothetical protein CG723_40790 [Streptomyces sp. CB01635]|nr:hypothetical protein CG723_40790 [Streptomyces sp. CB01635]
MPIRRRLIIAAIIVIALFAGQTAALIVQQQQIHDLQSRSQKTGPRGPAGPAGPSGERGPAGNRGVAGPAGKDGRDATDVGTVIPPGDSNARVTPGTQTEARAYCTSQAAEAWPDSSDSDPSADQLTDTYTSATREKAFQQCMKDEGFPQS